MTGKLKVLPATATVPSAAQVDKQVAKQIKKDLHGARVADSQANRDAVKQNKDGTRTLHVTAGTSSHDGKVALLEFFPRVLDAKPGDSVVFKPKSPNEPHTVTFPGDFGTEMVNLVRPLRVMSRSGRPISPVRTIRAKALTRSNGTVATASGT